MSNKTKEEILRKRVGNLILETFQASHIYNEISKAMDEYAGQLIFQTSYTESITEIPKEVLDQYSKSVAIEFVKFIEDEYQQAPYAEKRTYIKKLGFKDLKEWPDPQTFEKFTTEQLYNLFIQDQNKQQ